MATLVPRYVDFTLHPIQAAEACGHADLDGVGLLDTLPGSGHPPGGLHPALTQELRLPRAVQPGARGIHPL